MKMMMKAMVVMTITVMLVIETIMMMIIEMVMFINSFIATVAAWRLA